MMYGLLHAGAIRLLRVFLLLQKYDRKRWRFLNLKSIVSTAVLHCLLLVFGVYSYLYEGLIMEYISSVFKEDVKKGRSRAIWKK